MNMEKTETLSYKLDVFEGPLDLLLNLIAKNKLNIYDIPIAELLEQYMAQIHEMQAADMLRANFLRWRRVLCTSKVFRCCRKRKRKRH